MSPGDVILIRFPRTDLRAAKLRPALIIAASPGRHDGYLISPISSRVYQAIPEFDEVIESTDPDYAKSGLKARSVVRLARLTSVESSVIGARLGSISPERLQRVQ